MALQVKKKAMKVTKTENNLKKLKITNYDRYNICYC